ncbi:hypothetical protein M8818_007105 [Zalaria obscura]|uniref:Uncharacterized protein n=1 Tax=Zalaria obscura TaxID=2024903 RepID=A0ACC3S539_9PEZI
MDDQDHQQPGTPPRPIQQHRTLFGGALLTPPSTSNNQYLHFLLTPGSPEFGSFEPEDQYLLSPCVARQSRHLQPTPRNQRRRLASQSAKNDRGSTHKVGAVPGQIQWTQKHIRGLYLLQSKICQGDWQATVKAFNHYFEADLREWGLPNGADKRRLQSQYGEHRKARLPRIPDEAEAQGNIPTVFYRVYHDDSQGRNGPDGFISGLFKHMHGGGFPPPPPFSDPRVLYDVLYHMDRKEIPSPFISVSITLNWVIRMALQAMKDGRQNVRVAVVDATIAAKGKAAFYAKAYHKSLCTTDAAKPFRGLNWMYSGSHEYLIWANIPPEAILSDFPISELSGLAATTPALTDFLKLDILGVTGHNLRSTIMPYLKEQNVQMTPARVAGIAKLAVFLGVFSVPAQVAKVVGDIIQGWCLHPGVRDQQEWRKVSAFFADVLLANAPSSTVNKLAVMDAFERGVISGLADNANWTRKPKEIVTVKNRAAAIGLHMEPTTRNRLLAVVIDKKADMAVAAARRHVRRFIHRGEKTRALLA